MNKPTNECCPLCRKEVSTSCPENVPDCIVNHFEIICSNPDCPCHREKSECCGAERCGVLLDECTKCGMPCKGIKLDTPPKNLDIPYNQKDHAHCWEYSKDYPPCGQKIEHLKCCLCIKLNPKVDEAFEAGKEEGLKDIID